MSGEARRRGLRAIRLAGAIWFAFGAGAFAQGDQTDPLHDAERSVVRVVTVSLDAAGEPMALETGSGFAVAPGVVVTNHHVVQGAAQAADVETFVIPERDSGGQSVRAKVTQTWADADLALLQAPGLSSPPMTIAQTTPGKEATVRALGYPGVTDALRNLPLTEILRPQETYVTAGSIALFSSVAPGGARIDTIFHTAPINPGNSGGPLIDACGRVIGVNTWSAGDELGDDGQMTSPQGQFIATQSSVLAKFLSDAQVSATLAGAPCVPAAVQTLQDRLKADEAAITAQNADFGRVQAQLQALDSQVRQLSMLLSAMAAAVGLLTAVLIAVRFWPKSKARRAAKAAAGTPGPQPTATPERVGGPTA